MFNIYRLTTNAHGYDTYTACIVAASSLEAAKLIHPNHMYHIEKVGDEYRTYVLNIFQEKYYVECYGWDLTSIRVELLGTTDLFTESTLLLADYHNA